MIFMYLSPVAGEDYVSASVDLEFAPGDSQSCHIVDILQDNICEHPDPEDFFADLAKVRGIEIINIVRDTTQILIDDSDEPECSELQAWDMMEWHSAWPYP